MVTFDVAVPDLPAVVENWKDWVPTPIGTLKTWTPAAKLEATGAFDPDVTVTLPPEVVIVPMNTLSSSI